MRKYIVRVFSENDAGPTTYTVRADSKIDAMQIAFCLDGGFRPVSLEDEDGEDHAIALRECAQMHCEAEEVPDDGLGLTYTCGQNMGHVQ